MSRYLLAAVLAALSPALADPLDATCDETELRRLEQTPAARSSPSFAELDRRARLVLAAERRLEVPADARRNRLFWGAAVGVVTLATLLSVAGLLRRRRVLYFGGVVLLLTVAALATPLHRALHLDGADPQALLTLSHCRLRIAEARATLQSSQYAACVGQLAETDEDLLGFATQLRAGTPITLPQVTKLRTELQTH